MTRFTRMLRQGVFAAATIAALGFGATQAFAAPRAQADAARVCSRGQHEMCHATCVWYGYDRGWCIGDGLCECL
jgi:hypothetical protein